MRFQPRKLWWDDRIEQEKLKALYTTIRENAAIVGEEFALMNVSERDLFKHSLIIPYSISYEQYINGEIVKQDGFLFTYFQQGQAPYFATISSYSKEN